MTIIAGESKDACRLSLSLMLLLATVSTATAGSLGGLLELQDFGSFFVGGRPLEVDPSRPGPDRPGSGRTDQDWPDVRPISYPQDRERAGDRHGARRRPYRGGLRDDA